MKFNEIAVAATKIVEFVNMMDLKPDEKVAALGSARAVIENVLSAELLTLKLRQFLDDRPGNK